MNIKLLKKGDIAVIAVIAAVAVAFMIFMRSGNINPVATVTVDGKIIETVNLSSLKEKIIITPETQPKVTIIAENGEIYFAAAECEDKLCVNSGKLKNSGDTAVCLPAKTVITVSGSDVDAVVY